MARLVGGEGLRKRPARATARKSQRIPFQLRPDDYSGKNPNERQMTAIDLSDLLIVTEN